MVQEEHCSGAIVKVGLLDWVVVVDDAWRGDKIGLDRGGVLVLGWHGDRTWRIERGGYVGV